MSNNFSLDFKKSPFIAISIISFISFGLAAETRLKTNSSLILLSIAAQLCNTFSSFLQSPSEILYRALTASSFMFKFSFKAIFSIIFLISFSSKGLNLNTVQRLRRGSIIFEL